MNNNKPLLLTVKESSTLLRVQRPKIYELIKDGALDGFKVGADWRIRTDSLERLVGEIPQTFFDTIKDSDIESMGFDAEIDERIN
ncbi:MAG TPA: helix-turn-helix domain-containing protein [Oligoflexia bacterium]|nr:helix-turn-helix domain-containing protein [Oligoflexia bacterium]HMP48661.1 helix-turn-helix domain-containing protein [Oligoflexia bacterium]